MTFDSLILLLLYANLLAQIDCGRVCYSCTGMAENDSCHNVATCQDDEVCFTQKYQTEDNKTQFDVGCSYPELCRKDSMGTIFGKRTSGLGHIICHRCCLENVCNSDFTCTDDFKAPSLRCMYCSGIDMVDKCNSTISCTNDEVCFIQKYRTPMNQVRYDLGCKRSTVCQNGFYSNMFGRRSNNEKHLICESCCAGSSFCNSNLVCSHHNQSTVNASCTSTNGCQSNLVCLSGKCQCATKDYYWSEDRCKLQKKVYQRCAFSYECIKPLECRNSTCQCPTWKYWNGSECRTKKQLTSICKTSQECSETLFCIHGVCKCDRIDYWTGHNCSTRKNVHSICKITDECKDLLHCVNGSCSCLDTVNRFWNGEDCVPISECSDIPFLQSGVYHISPKDSHHSMLALCVIEAGVKWTVIQRRVNGSFDFDRTWQEYKEGFGNANGEFWLGNEAIHLISANGRHKLRVDLEVSNGGKYYAEYSTFLLNDEHSQYLLNVTGYNGTAGDSLDSVNSDGRANGAPFTTKDRSNNKSSCNRSYHGGWWYVNCEYTDLNRRYGVNGKPYYMDWRYNLGITVVKSMMMISKY